MKVLTICQPYAELIIRGDKLVENREWQPGGSPPYRGPLLIHAGKSKSWLNLVKVGNDEMDVEYDIMVSEMTFGAVIGVVDLVQCLHINQLRGPYCDDRYRQLAYHEHTHGPYCWILENPRRFDPPIPCRGMQGLWDVPELTKRIVDEELARMQ
jgi:hypothetical protein